MQFEEVGPRQQPYTHFGLKSSMPGSCLRDVEPEPRIHEWDPQQTQDSE